MTVERNATWLVVGSSLSAPKFFDAALLHADVTITTNAGWQLFLTADLRPGRLASVPDYYWLSDPVAIHLFGRARDYMRRQGAKIITSALKADGEPATQEDGDIFVNIPARHEQCPGFRPGEYVHPRLSGLICLQFALNAGAARVLLLGMDGYRSNPNTVVRDTFDGRPGKPAGELQTQQWIGPFVRSAVAACPDVEFIQIGFPEYKVRGSNYRVIQSVESINRRSAASWHCPASN